MSVTRMNRAEHGPAHLAIHEATAHKDYTCEGFAHAVLTATADEGEMAGFVWCEKCGDGEFRPEPEDADGITE